METNNFQDKSGCSINGFRSFLFEQGIVQDLEEMEKLIDIDEMIQDYRGYPIILWIEGSKAFPLSDEILRMKNVQFNVRYKSKPIHKLVSPEPHFVEEERNLIENHFSYLGDSYDSDDIEDWECFEMNCEGHLVSMHTFQPNFHLTNESIEHLSNFPQLRNLDFCIEHEIGEEEDVTNLSLLSDLTDLSIGFEGEFEDPEFFKDLGLFSDLLSLEIIDYYGGF